MAVHHFGLVVRSAWMAHPLTTLESVLGAVTSAISMETPFSEVNVNGCPSLLATLLATARTSASVTRAKVAWEPRNSRQHVSPVFRLQVNPSIGDAPSVPFRLIPFVHAWLSYFSREWYCSHAWGNGARAVCMPYVRAKVHTALLAPSQ